MFPWGKKLVHCTMKAAILSCLLPCWLRSCHGLWLRGQRSKRTPPIALCHFSFKCHKAILIFLTLVSLYWANVIGCCYRATVPLDRCQYTLPKPFYFLLWSNTFYLRNSTVLHFQLHKMQNKFLEVILSFFFLRALLFIDVDSQCFTFNF